MKFGKTTASVLSLVLGSATVAAAFPATSTTSLNVRSGPGTGYAVVDTLRPGETVDVTAQSGGWYEVDGQGWASANYLDAGGGYSTSYYQDDGYYAGYGPASYYYGSYPAYYSGGVYFYVRDGRRHRVDRSDLREARREVRRERRDVQNAREERRELRGDRNESRREVRQLRRDDAPRAERREARRDLRQDRRELREGRASVRQERRELRGARQELIEERRGR